MKIMFICTGNICRSAMAEALLKDKANKINKDIEVCSCGVFAQNGEGSTKEAIKTMKEREIDLNRT